MLRTFYCESFPRLSLSAGYKSVNFEKGVLATDDPDIIRKCEESPLISAIGFAPAPKTLDILAKPEAPTNVEPMLFYTLAQRTTKQDAVRYAGERGLDVDTELPREEFIAAVNSAQREKLTEA